ncbi:MAG: dockerin type I repeat-containing protein [Clostridia bacterium]|nr:dockerin type I repeat-containing protein [Clostridia bacterium]
MKILSVLLSILLVLSLCITANAAETDSPVMKPLGDVTLDGKVTADDARFILRTAVGLDSIPSDSVIYCDCDFDGAIGASDARLALRTAVGLEEKQSYSFEITDNKAASCSEEGFIKGKCAVTDKEVSITVKKLPHTPPENIGCTGKGKCTVCGEELTAEIAHDWKYTYEYGKRECLNCGVTEYFKHTHDFSDITHSCACGDAKTIFQKELKYYLLEKGRHENNECFVAEYIEPVTFAFSYNKATYSTYVFSGFAVESEGMVVYYEFYFDFTKNTVNTRVFLDDTWVADIMADITPGKVDETADGDAVSLTQYEVIDDLNGMQSMFRIMIEGAVYDMVQWMLLRGSLVECDYMEHVVADFVNVK